MNKLQLIKTVEDYLLVAQNHWLVIDKLNKLFGGFEGEVGDILGSYYTLFWETLTIACGERIDLSVIDHWLECKVFSKIDVVYYYDGAEYNLNDITDMIELSMIDYDDFFKVRGDLIIK